MKRLLCIVSAMDTGGAETFLMKLYRNIDTSKYQMDFCVNKEENFYRAEIEQLGGKIFVVPLKSQHPIKSFNELKRIVKENNYEAVMRVNEHSLSVLDLLAAKAGGAKKLAMRSSNASSGSKKSIMLHKLFKFLPKTVPDIKIAPSKLAAEYTFGKKAVEKGEVHFLHNGLNLEQYRFDSVIREKYRTEMKLNDKLVIGHVGRFSQQKNHEFLIKVFSEIKKLRENAVLVLVGCGELEDKIKEQVKNIGIENSVLFLGRRADIPQLLSAMDGFLFPSFFEGMPNTVIEAQTAGLPCLISDSITDEAAVTPLVSYDSLEQSPEEWSGRMCSLIDNNKMPREDAMDIMREKGYDIDSCVHLFERIIFE